MSGATARSGCTGRGPRPSCPFESSSSSSGTSGSRRSNERLNSRKGRAMEASTETAIRREVAIAASPETVWEFLVDPEKATRWMGQSASFDPRPGGEYRVEVLSGNVAVGEFVELDPPRRLVWTWGWEPGSPVPVAAGSSTIEVELVPEGDGTRLRFT